MAGNSFPCSFSLASGSLSFLSSMAASPPFATQVSVDKLTKLVQDLHAKLDKLFASPPSTAPLISTVIDQKTDSYASVVRAFVESEKIKNKSQRAVLVGSLEKSTPEETAQHDEQVLKEIIDATHDKDLKDAYTSGSITHKRFPENKAPGRRIVKYNLPSTNLRDRLLSGIRSIGRPVSFEPSMFLRRDLMPSELSQEKNSRDEARKRNSEAGCLKWGVRDCELIKFRGPSYRPLPEGYLKNNDNASKQAKSNEQSKEVASSISVSNQQSKSNPTDTIATSVPILPTKSTVVAAPDFVTTRKKEEKSSTSPPPSTVPSSGGTTARDERASSLH